jgi:hypothetical protein
MNQNYSVWRREENSPNLAKHRTNKVSKFENVIIEDNIDMKEGLTWGKNPLINETTSLPQRSQSPHSSANHLSRDHKKTQRR